MKPMTNNVRNCFLLLPHPLKPIPVCHLAVLPGVLFCALPARCLAYEARLEVASCPSVLHPAQATTMLALLAADRSVVLKLSISWVALIPTCQSQRVLGTVTLNQLEVLGYCGLNPVIASSSISRCFSCARKQDENASRVPLVPSFYVFHPGYSLADLGVLPHSNSPHIRIQRLRDPSLDVYYDVERQNLCILSFRLTTSLSAESIWLSGCL
ncbi:hypothetical protein B0H12DRAFT_333561 [Mycena haematopus]|nr:hypothetical protein B0H12DRAFT_333561 [Mycena haematopus]